MVFADELPGERYHAHEEPGAEPRQDREQDERQWCPCRHLRGSQGNEGIGFLNERFVVVVYITKRAGEVGCRNQERAEDNADEQEQLQVRIEEGPCPIAEGAYRAKRASMASGTMLTPNVSSTARSPRGNMGIASIWGGRTYTGMVWTS
ncbi:hypothetical protein CC80DRAFT_14281 [Byssothecium circinans]|uniref:Uncharacterized protein n=1 Tax=Byssothecium circinans TaxID=147558 RepID=A0A6A5U1M8_9PLEO|nr:hypothetical protein CC80DRAFT_14281 [Byssothecium circinans]